MCAFRKGSTETSVTVDGRGCITAAEGVREAVFAGLGLAVAPEWMFAPELKRGLVRGVLTGLDLAADGVVGGLPDWATNKREGACLRRFH